MKLLNGIDHIDIVVEDITAMRGFFEAVGFRLVRETEHGGGAVELRFPGEGNQPILELTPRIAGGVVRPLGLRHVALRAADLDRAVVALSARGLTLEGPPRHIAQTGRRLADLIDPVGNVLQLVEV